VLGFGVNILLVGVELNVDGLALKDAANGSLRSTGGLSADWVLVNENTFFSGLPKAGWLGLSRMLLKTLEVAEPGLFPLDVCHLLL
jgi:hypothetical protein